MDNSIKLLLDANLSHLTSKYLREKFHIDVKDLISLDLGDINDEEVIKLATKERRTLITFDLDFGEIFYFKEILNIGIIILKLKDQTVESVNTNLDHFFSSNLLPQNLENQLIIIEESKVRIINKN